MKRFSVEVDLATTLEIDADSPGMARELAKIGWHHSFAGFPVECDFERVEVMGEVQETHDAERADDD